jgi:broad specificity phosphatase PhoE
MTRLLLVRHAHVEGIAPERFRGRADVPLSPLGRRQAATTAETIGKRWDFAAVYTSPLARAVATGEAIAARRSLEAQPLPALNDIDYGQWQWKTHEEVQGAWPVLFERWLNAPDMVRLPGGESLAELAARAADALRLIAERHPDDGVVAVGHDSVNRAMLMQALAQPLSAYWRLGQSPCGISEIEMVGDLMRVVRMNETAHLEALKL